MFEFSVSKDINKIKIITMIKERIIAKVLTICLTIIANELKN